MNLQSNVEKIDKKVLYAMAVFGDEERAAVAESLNNRWLASGPKVKEFEQEIAKLFGKKHGVAVNSGSSANLLALSVFDKEDGAEIITPACTFATTVSAILLNGMVPVFVDSVVGRYTIDEEVVEAAITDKTVAIMVPQLVGGVCNMPKLREIADKHNLVLIDDSCDTLAPRYKGAPVAQFSDLTTTSFYGSHIITAMGIGGMILTDNDEFLRRLLVKRDWGRAGNDQEDFKTRFDFEIDTIPYDSKFIYEELGFNLKLNEASAAFGLEQVKKLPTFLETRKQNFKMYTEFFKQYEDWFFLPYTLEDVDTNWLAYPLTIKPGAPFTRYELLEHLEKNGIQTRVLFSGNITRHPLYKKVHIKTFGLLSQADLIMQNGFLIGCHQGMGEKEIEYVAKVAKEFFDKCSQ